jgi:hypothetical protein
MAHIEESTYRVRITVPGRAPMEAMLRTVGGMRVPLEHWNQPDDPNFYIVQLNGPLDADVVEYAAVSFHPVRPA